MSDKQMENGNAFRYKRIEQIGKGGFGVVWKARDRQTGVEVALKVLQIPEDYQTDAKLYEQFQSEIELARSLNHPYVLPAIDHGFLIEDGRQVPYLVSPYMPDGSLAQLIRETPPWQHWTLEQTVDAIRQAALALDYLHMRKIVHRDVKPANFLVQRMNSPLQCVRLFLGDFGISRWQKAEVDETSNLVGTERYMAPEYRFYGKVSPKIDQFALAVLAYCLVVGRFPPPLNLERHEAHLRPPSSVMPERIPLRFRKIDRVILQALSWNPSDRFVSVKTFAQELLDAISSSSSPVLDEERTEIDTAKLLSPSQKEVDSPADQMFFDIPPITYKELVKPAQGLLHDLVWQRHELEKPPLPQPQLLPLLSPSRLIFTEDVKAMPRMVHWSPDGHALICVFYQKEAILLSEWGGRWEISCILGAASTACWGPGGELLALCSQNALQIDAPSMLSFWNRTMSKPQSFLLPYNEVEDMDWSRRGQLAVWAAQYIYLYQLSQNFLSLAQLPLPQKLGELRPELICGGVGVLRWSPDGLLLAAGTAKGAILCWNLTAPTPVLQWQTPETDQQIYSLAWSRDGRLLAVAFGNKRVQVWDMSFTNRPRREWTRLPAVPLTVSISVDQRLLVASNSDLFSGNVDDSAPTARYPGLRLASWSPIGRAFVTLNVHNETELAFWEG